jgi:beta-glucosidase
MTSPAELLASMTLDEKASLTAGAGLWYLPPVERLGVPALKVSDGPSGVRGDSMLGRRSLSLPCGMAVGSTWNTELVGRLGGVLAAEAVSKGVHVLLGPTVCIVRTPLAGRTFESFSEDPHLTARLAVAYVEGVQRGGVACCIKHFACNDQETERMTISAEVDERTLREVHLVAFEAAVREAGVWSVMTAYNKVNGVYCGEQPDLIAGILRGEWGFDGLVMSDWFGTHSTLPAAQAGLDLEMPGPAAWLSHHSAAAVRAGELDESVVDGQAGHVLRLMERVGLLEGTHAPAPELEEDDPGRRAVARQVAVEGTVLLVNDGLLPLEVEALSSVAVIGPNAAMLEMGGGSSEVTPHRRRRVVDALAERLPPGVVVTHDDGCRIDQGRPSLDPRLLDGGYRVDYFDNADRAGEPVATEWAHRSRMNWIGLPHPALAGADQLSIRVSATFRPDVSGLWELGLESAGRSDLRIEGELVLDNSNPQRGAGFYGAGSTMVTNPHHFEAGTSYAVTVDLWPRAASSPILGVLIAASRPVVADAFERAVQAAAAADVAVVVVGSNGQWESEGFDRPDLSLPGEQDDLVTAVLAANPRTIVVVNAGSPVDMPWADDAAAVLVCWYPGEEGADALADIVTGTSEPSGRLPVTIPRTVPVAPGSGGTVPYDEGVFVGYRGPVDARFAFGHGLSYGSFSYGSIGATAGGISIELANTGPRRGTEVVQVYLRCPDSRVPRPERQLIAFEKVTLEPGQQTTVELEIAATSFRYWDGGGWRTDAGAYQLLVGASSSDIWATVDITVDLP